MIEDSFVGFVVLPPQKEAYEKAEDACAENERACNWNSDPGEHDEANCDNCAGASAGNTQAAIFPDEIWFAFGHVSATNPPENQAYWRT
jgi:hypothetical protein